MNIDLEKYDSTVYIVAGGPSLKTFDWSLLDDSNKFVVAINASHHMLANCNIIYVTDPPYIQDNIKSLTEHKAEIWQGALNPNIPKKLSCVTRQIHLRAAQGLINEPNNPYVVAHGSNSTFACLSVMANLGFRKIFLHGVDMKYGGENNISVSHWHSDTHPHVRVDPPSVYVKMLDAYATIKQPLLDRGIVVVNVNTQDGTDLKTFPIKSVDEVFNLKT